MRRALLAAPTLFALGLAVLATACDVQSLFPKRETAEVEEPALPANPCAVRTERPITLREGVAGDKLVATMDGTSCADTKMTLSVVAADGAVLYARDVSTVDVAGDDGAGGAAGFLSAADATARLADPLNALAQKTSQFASWKAGAPSPDPDIQSPLTREDYMRLRALDAPTYCLAVAPDQTECIVYDPESKTGQVFLRQTF